MMCNLFLLLQIVILLLPVSNLIALYISSALWFIFLYNHFVARQAKEDESDKDWW